MELVDPVVFQKMGTVTQSQLYPISDLLADTRELLKLREPVALHQMGSFSKEHVVVKRCHLESFRVSLSKNGSYLG